MFHMQGFADSDILLILTFKHEQMTVDIGKLQFYEAVNSPAFILSKNSGVSFVELAENRVKLSI